MYQIKSIILSIEFARLQLNVFVKLIKKCALVALLVEER
jgi:hypothetical protein